MREMRNDPGLLSKVRGALAVAALAATIATASAQGAGLPKLHTDEAYVDDVTQAKTLDVKDPMAVFAFVLNSLP